MIGPPRFWWRQRLSVAQLALLPIAAIWSAIAARRMRRPASARADVAVICIGNFVVGGAGKTPTALAVAKLAIELGLKPGFLTRGYGGSAREALLVDPVVHRSAEVGDEALLLAAMGPTVVSPNRPAALPILEEAGVDLIIMDDGFQNPSLAKDLSWIVVDGVAGIGNGSVIPAGPLRAALPTQMVRADAIIIVGSGSGGDGVLRKAARAGRIVLRAQLLPQTQKDWGSRPYLAFAGIGRPEKFFDSLRRAGARVREALPFPDHHAYTEDDAQKLLAKAEHEGLQLITTAKDHARLAKMDGALERLRQRTEVFRVRMLFADEARVSGMIAEVVRKASARG